MLRVGIRSIVYINEPSRSESSHASPVTYLFDSGAETMAVDSPRSVLVPFRSLLERHNATRATAAIAFAICQNSILQPLLPTTLVPVAPANLTRLLGRSSNNLALSSDNIRPSD